MNDFNKIMMSEPSLAQWNIFLCYSGSISYGLSHFNSDTDLTAICIPPKEYYLGLKEFGSRGTKEIKQGNYDIVIYDLKKFVQLLVKGNPNALSILWTDEQFVINQTKESSILQDHKELFLGKHIYNQFAGFAKSNLKRIKSNKINSKMGEKRKKIIDNYGYDVKSAMHTIRILKMLVEFLKEGRFNVLRNDKNELQAIKNGEWSLEQVYSTSQSLLKESEELFQRSKMPNNCDLNKINTLLLNIFNCAY